MRKITLSLFALLVTIVAYCGAPQAINYQAVAYSSTGTTLKAKPIALRLSILSGSSAGPVSYQERQTATTDNTGTVSVQIGNGTVLSGTFAGIDWSTGSYFLKTEIDTNAGTNYLAVGNVQFFSVPFALYADKSGQSNLASQDYPDGLNSITPIRMDGNFNYVVPAGQTLYIQQITHNNSGACPTYGAVVDGVFLTSGAASTSTSGGSQGSVSTGSAANRSVSVYPMTIPEGQAITSTTCGTSMVGFTVAKGYSWVLFDLSTGNYTVPVGKIFVLKNMVTSPAANWNGYYSVNGMTTNFNKTPTFASEGQTITASGLSGSLLMMGYVKNK